MKELSIEEKAKRYDEALEKAKKIHNEHKAQPFDIMLRVFPELAESEDERIRKELIRVFSNREKYVINQSFGDINVSDILAWLEKQGEQKSIESMSEFKEGDILYNKDSYASDSIFIFKGMADKTNAYLCYARLYDGKDFSVYSKKDWDEGVGIYGGEFYPANHKQKELLFSEIEKAGYKWNSEKLELKKIEQNPAWSEEDEAVLDALIQRLEGGDIHVSPHLAVKCLKSLKDRVQPQPQKQWKPTSEQIKALEAMLTVSPQSPAITSALIELYQQLKKLREE